MRILIALAIVGALAACSPQEPTAPEPPVAVDPVEQPSLVLRFGLYASGQPVDLIQDFRPILDELEVYLQKHLGEDVQIKLILSKTYARGVDVIVEGSVDFARFGPASYVEAYGRNPEIDVLALEAINNEKVFHGIIAVHKDSDITDISQLRGKDFAFGDERSTIGRYLSQLYLADNGVLAVDLESFAYLNRHDKVGEAVGLKHYAAGALNEKTFKRLVSQGVPIKELARFDNVTKPWISREGLDENIETLLRNGLLQITDPQTVERLKITGFVEGGDADYSSIRESILNNRKFFEGYLNPEQDQ